ncbi:uncharacterized protein LOC132271602 [Cornus florida]|uniref:uncharacterized protein LOC132271602 n=1 Tax=Cornus florida TaxID=4283 RepID=UPI0028A2654D|nr:uncharacterized protein LOC132271602 [Cornus florida]
MDKFVTRGLPPSLRRDDGSSKISDVEINLEDLAADPGLRTPILNYHPDIRDQIRRAYLLKGPCQPKKYHFPYKSYGQCLRRFNPAWFDAFSTWLENSKDKDEAYCLCCYLFKPKIGEQSGGDTFVSEGFSNWKKGLEKLQSHIGGPKSAHNQCSSMCQALMKQKQHIQSIFFKQSEKTRIAYRTRLIASIDCVRHLLRQGLAFRGDDETEDSSNQGNFLETLRFLVNHNEDINAVTLQNAPENHKLMAPKIQKDIVNAIALETLNVIIGDIVERFVGLVHVSDTTSISLKKAIDALFSRHGLSISRLRGQGYDGASNMRGQFNGLKTLILKENECAFYIHGFAHQLQLALVGMAKKHEDIVSLFTFVANLINIVGGSCKRCDILREKQASIVTEALNNGELSSGQGLNQNTSLKRASDTRWGSHYDTLISVTIMFSAIVNVLETLAEDGSSEKKFEVNLLLEFIQSFNFIFCLHLMRAVLGITNDLSKALQRKDQDIVVAMSLVKLSKVQLQRMRESGWDSLLNEVSSFFVKHDIPIPNMDDTFLPRGRLRRKAHDKSNLHHYRVDLFNSIIDMQLQELTSRFSEMSSELLLCVACLCLDDSFCAFEKQKLIHLAQFYPKEFSSHALMRLSDQLENYIADMRSICEFEGLKGIGDLAKKMVETKRDKVHSLVYLLVTLALILPVATASVERTFSAMNIVKNRLRNKMGDEWMSDSLIVYIEKEISSGMDNEVIIQRFQNMTSRWGQL